MIGSFSLGELVPVLDAKLQGEDVSFNTVSTDTRSISPGDLFVALRGASFNGNEYVDAAAAAGAVAAIVDCAGDYPLPSLQVADTQLALGQLGAANRERFSGDLVAITGSVGKTSVKNMLASILATQGPTLATPGNLNNEIGVPTTLLQLNEEHRYAVVEMGAGKAGDVAYLCQLGKPRVGMLLNAMPAHLDGFGSVDGVAHAKSEIFSTLSANGTAVFLADSPYAPLWRKVAGSVPQIEFGFADAAVVRAESISVSDPMAGTEFVLVTPAGRAPVSLPWPGRHNIANALAAAAAAHSLGVDLQAIAAGLTTVQLEPGRVGARRATSGALVIDDTYNANPGSVRAAIDTLAAADGNRVLILADMLELGSISTDSHREIGEYAAANIDEVWLTGTEVAATASGFGSQAHCFECRDDLIAALSGRFGRQDIVLVKGSRSMGMEHVVQALLAEQGEVG
ncbi:UDP-N-acetylmuramoyl-tripeptide--D-alanyl-D-alanine ligase [Halieaceae bacterium IMCC14734]|uniref:UDP-N-acetylmuramoyl-tripeptide--D-alanyl-D-alanine ligase n=1 Tax=Candidatus Litorirhabdus singularis TaxID=2518993 RepID=A0ABT3TJB2_9GAMM|nr:UDP-N-acetylmuramoyl-tripeptide--D-alanyl-D-alanine ligase [Candidatus Litorirhabdus singularis]MCX2982406.1 UDP-N-acetylmuramoyl-tripeptide--D-alanyl-D-alanine ligase [Candidatus Litorirhabdus singularis]